MGEEEAKKVILRNKNISKQQIGTMAFSSEQIEKSICW